MKDMRGKVVVITGASSGLGRAAAVRFAELGSSLALAARSEEGLEVTAGECRAKGAPTIVIPTDVTREDEVTALIARVLEEWGRIDVFVNDAAVTFFAALSDGAFADHRRVIETNVIGSMLCARAVVPVFRRQKSGVLINVSSLLGKVGNPFVASYVVSKFAVRGLSEALRAELADEPDIHVCSLFPFAMDTPHFQSGANAMGHPARPLPPMQSAEGVAGALVGLAMRPRRSRHVPRASVLALGVHSIAPRFVEQLVLRALVRWHFAPEGEPRSKGALYKPSPKGGAVHGDRPPRLGTIPFIVWVMREAARIARDRSREGDVVPAT
jgi:NAD(P)-dependent dehydrogenase (short-subunit alcohol dehydrogenase family)